MIKNFEYNGIKYRKVPKEEIPSYTDADNNIFIIGDIFSKKETKDLIQNDIERFMDKGLLLENYEQRQNLENEIDVYLTFSENMCGYNIKKLFCFVEDKSA